MKKLLLSIIITLNVTFLYAVPTQEMGQIKFGGGVDYKTDCADIADNRACDMNNMISDFLGTSSKRFGSEKYIDQAISSQPIKGLFRAYYSTGLTINKATIMVNDGNIYVDTTTTVEGHVWSKRKSGLNTSQSYEFRQYQQYVMICGDSLDDNVFKYNVQTDSVTENFSATNSGVVLTARHSIFSKNYYLVGNIKEFTNGTTYYPPRVHYTQLLTTPTHISSMTTFRWFEIDEEIMGMGEINGSVHIFGPSGITEIAFDKLDLTSNSGDQTYNKKVSGFGCVSRGSLVSNGKFYTFLSKDGIRMYDPTGRLTAQDETRIISTPVEPIIKRILENGTYANSQGVFYEKRNWYIFSYEDPLKYPRGRPNSTLVFDFNTGEWYPFSNWLPGCWTTFKNIDDSQECVYGDSNDGYVYYIDQESYLNDSRKEIVIDNCDIASKWARSVAGVVIKEGTASIKLTGTTPTFYSSITLMQTINLGEWYDKTEATKSDFITFKVYPSSLANITSLRVDLELDTVSDDFNVYFTSVTISSNALTSGTSVWNTVKIAFSSFPILDDWVNVSSGVLPFANAPTVYGLRIFSTGIGWHEVTIDDVRFVSGETPLRAYRFTKQFNFGTNAKKLFRQTFLDCEQSATSKFYIDTYSDFGKFENRQTVTNTFDKDIFVTGYNSQEGIFRLNGNTFEIEDSTIPTTSAVFAPRPITADEDYVYVGDQYNDRIMKFDRDNLETLVDVVGSSNVFNIPFQMALREFDRNTSLYVCDFANHSLKVYNAKTMKLKKNFGELGSGATNFFCPTGIAVDDTDIFIFQDANYRLQKWSATSYDFKDSVVLNLNSVGNIKLAVDERYVYLFYSKITAESLLYTECWLEKRNKSDLKLVSKTKILPDGVASDSVVTSTYSVQGDIGINDETIIVSFTDDSNKNGNYYIQKRLKDGVNFPIIKEYSSTGYSFSAASNGLTYKAKRKTIVKDIGVDNTYIQFRFSEDLLDNSFKLYKFAPILIPQSIKER